MQLENIQMPYYERLQYLAENYYLNNNGLQAGVLYINQLEFEHLVYEISLINEFINPSMSEDYLIQKISKMISMQIFITKGEMRVS